MTSSRYFLYRDNVVEGPYESTEIREWNLDPGMQVCPEGREEWLLLGQVGALLPPPKSIMRTPLAALAANATAPTMFAESLQPKTERKKIFIIHGRGNTMHDAFDRILKLERSKIRYYQSDVYVDEQNSNFARYILYDVHTNPFTVLFDKILTGKIALAPHYPPPEAWRPDPTWTKLSDFKVSDKLRLYGAPMSAIGVNREWCDEFFAGIHAEFGRLLGKPILSHPALSAALVELRSSLELPEGGRHIEKDYKDAIRARFAGISDPEAFIAFLIEFQRLNDSGGDLDTIASNALYGAWIIELYKKQYGTTPQYGRDFEFDFVNYHQSFLHLARHKNCDIYLPDFPMEAIPDLEEAARALKQVNSSLIRVDDHHPLGPERIALLNRLQAEGLLDAWVMSGPIKGSAQETPEELTCGADLVHREMIANRGFDTPGLEELRRLAHQQDLHLIENPDDRTHADYLAIDLSKLIGSKHSRIDMAQQLMFVRSFEDMREIMNRTGWRQIVDSYEAELERTLPKLEACMARVDFVMPAEVAASATPISTFVKKITFGKVDLAARSIAKKHPELVHRIFFSMAPFQARKEHRINVASAIGHFKKQFRFDYFFYAWGSNLLTTRRFNDKDQVLDLSVLMGMIGGPGDGGHSSAATCKPPSNPAWPKDQFARLGPKNFNEYVRYIAKRIEKGVGAQIVEVKVLTEADRDF